MNPTYCSPQVSNNNQLSPKEAYPESAKRVKIDDQKFGKEKVCKNSPSEVIFPEYPNHGVIGSAEPGTCINIFYKPKSTGQDVKDYRKQKFDFHEIYEQSNSTTGFIQNATPIPGLGYLCRGLKTSDFYKIDPALPVRFREPDLLQGYGYEKPEHPLFRTTSSEYGKFAPTVHDVPYEYHGLKNSFTSHLTSTGMPRNRSLNIK